MLFNMLELPNSTCMPITISFLVFMTPGITLAEVNTPESMYDMQTIALKMPYKLNQLNKQLSIFEKILEKKLKPSQTTYSID